MGYGGKRKRKYRTAKEFYMTIEIVFNKCLNIKLSKSNK